MNPRTPSAESFPFATTEFHGMPYRRVGDSGLQAAAIGVGTWKFGYPETGDGSRSDEAQSLAVLDRAYELGATFWDTANRYNNGTGNSERVIGRWFDANPGRRRDIVLATKIFGGMDGYTPNHSGLSRLQTIDGVRASLDRLGVDRVDLLWFHRFDPHTPIEESLEAVEDLVSQGLVQYLGVSQFDVPMLEAYLEVASRLSRRCRPIAVQNQFDPLQGSDLPGVLEFCAAEGLSMVPYSPLAQGLLTDRYLDPSRVGAGDRLFDQGEEIAPEKLERVRAVGELAAQWGYSISQLTLAYLLTLPGMGPQIPSSSHPGQLDANAASASIELSAAQQEALRTAFAGG